MANEDLFPPLNWGNWDELPKHPRSNMKYTGLISAEAEELLWKESLAKFGDTKAGREKAVKTLLDARKLTPYNYVPPRHALESHMGFQIDPKNAYRLLGEKIDVRKGESPASVVKKTTTAVQDFLNTGQVRGNPNKVLGGMISSAPSAEALAEFNLGLERAKANGLSAVESYLENVSPIRKELPQAYFMPRHPQPTYYQPSQLYEADAFSGLPKITNGRTPLVESGTAGTIGQNTMIEISKDFAPIDQTVSPRSRNPLYYMGNQDSVDAMEFRGRGGLWGENTGAGAHITANPRENPTFGEVADFRNRKGIRILQETSPAITMPEKIELNQRAIYGKVPNSWSGAEDAVLPSQEAGLSSTTDKLKWGVKYDRITPFGQRPLSTHLANAQAEAEILWNAAKTRPMSNTGLGALPGKMGALTAVGKVGGGLLAPIQIGMQINALTKDNVMDREYGHSDPLALRPLMDFALSGIGNNQTPSQGLQSMEKMVADPEWQMRNPLAATAYNLAFGNTEPVKAFLGAYVPDFMK